MMKTWKAETMLPSVGLVMPLSRHMKMFDAIQKFGRITNGVMLSWMKRRRFETPMQMLLLCAR